MTRLVIISSIALSDISVITVKVPKKMKERMDELDVNWSEYIRKSITAKIDEDEIRKASGKLDEIRSKTKPVSTKELVSWIREDRNR
jgi:Arc/MetJ-type ribon-helix-helix transcriptional regulator